MVLWFRLQLWLNLQSLHSHSHLDGWYDLLLLKVYSKQSLAQTKLLRRKFHHRRVFWYGCIIDNQLRRPSWYTCTWIRNESRQICRGSGSNRVVGDYIFRYQQIVSHKHPHGRRPMAQLDNPFLLVFAICSELPILTINFASPQDGNTSMPQGDEVSCNQSSKYCHVKDFYWCSFEDIDLQAVQDLEKINNDIHFHYQYL